MRIPAALRLRRQRLRNVDEGPAVHFAAILSVVLVTVPLCTFVFRMNALLLAFSQADVKLPVVPRVISPEERVEPVKVSVRAAVNGSPPVIEVEERSFPNDASTVEAVKEMMRSRPRARLVIRADPRVRYPFMKQFLQDLAKAGITDVTFSVRESADSGPNF